MARSDRVTTGDDQAVAEIVRATERERLRALVTADVPRARQLHADDFQLINPLGGALSKDQYLGGIESGQIQYLFWEPGAIDLRLYGDMQSFGTSRSSKSPCSAATSPGKGIGTPISTNGATASGKWYGPTLLGFRNPQADEWNVEFGATGQPHRWLTYRPGLNDPPLSY